jgi:hypothetical protein
MEVWESTLDNLTTMRSDFKELISQQKVASPLALILFCQGVI